MLPRLANEALASLRERGLRLGAVAATRGPGMRSCLAIGYNVAQGLALALNVPFLGINHMHAHLLLPRMQTEAEFPYTSLLVSGGHTILVESGSLLEHRIVGETRDIAIGDYIDKLATLFGIHTSGMPGPALSQWACQVPLGDYGLTIPMANDTSLDFSFSGLLSQVTRKLPLADSPASLAHEALRAAFLHLRNRVAQIAPQKLVVSGGVASNSMLRSMLHPFSPILPPPHLCVDNAAMVAWAAQEMQMAGYCTRLGGEVVRKWRLDELLCHEGEEMYETCRK